MRGKLKSLGLSGARKAGREAMRKLFGRESSTVNGGSYDADVESPKSASGNSGPPAAQDSHLDPDALVTSEKHTVSPLSTDSNHKNELPTSQPDSTSGTTVDMTMRTLQPRNLQQQRLPPKNTNEADRFLATAPGKENQAPPAPAPHSATTIDEITKQIRDVSLIGELQLLTDERPLAPEIAPEVDEETRIEQAKHLALMGEALEMVSFSRRFLNHWIANSFFQCTRTH